MLIIIIVTVMYMNYKNFSLLRHSMASGEYIEAPLQQYVIYIYIRNMTFADRTICHRTYNAHVFVLGEAEPFTCVQVKGQERRGGRPRVKPHGVKGVGVNMAAQGYDVSLTCI